MTKDWTAGGVNGNGGFGIEGKARLRKSNVERGQGRGVREGGNPFWGRLFGDYGRREKDEKADKRGKSGGEALGVRR